MFALSQVENILPVGVDSVISRCCSKRRTQFYPCGDRPPVESAPVGYRRLFV